MTSDHIFWFWAGAMTSLAAVSIALPLFNQLRARRGTGRERAVMIGAVVIVIGASLAMYRLWGTPRAITVSAKESALVSSMGQAGADSLGGTAKVGSVEEATEKLAKRLNTTGGSAADWALLAQSYEFMGRSAEATQARQHAGLPAATSRADGSAATAPSPRVSPEGTNLLAQAEKARIAHDYKKALDLYAKAVKLDALDADAWANYADAAASVTGGKLDGRTGPVSCRGAEARQRSPQGVVAASKPAASTEALCSSSGSMAASGERAAGGFFRFKNHRRQYRRSAATVQRHHRVAGSRSNRRGANQRHHRHRSQVARQGRRRPDIVCLCEVGRLTGTAIGSGAHDGRAMAGEILSERLAGHDAAAQVIGLSCGHRGGSNFAKRPTSCATGRSSRGYRHARSEK